MLRTGVDLIEIDRIRQAIERNGDRFLQRVFTPVELALCDGKVESLAGRFAAKEAISKALGTGIWRNGINWTDIEIQRDLATGAPVLKLHGQAAKYAAEIELHEWSVSLSHDGGKAIAFVVAIG